MGKRIQGFEGSRGQVKGKKIKKVKIQNKLNVLKIIVRKLTLESLDP